MGVGYPGQIYTRSVPGPVEPVTLDVALIRQVTTPSGKEVSLMQDGETLKGGPEGDRFKLVVRTNCECFVYVVSVDGSGWAQPIFPVADGTVVNPLKPGNRTGLSRRAVLVHVGSVSRGWRPCFWWHHRRAVPIWRRSCTTCGATAACWAGGCPGRGAGGAPQRVRKNSGRSCDAGA